MQRAERQLLAAALKLEFVLDALQRMIAVDHLRGPVGAEHQQPRRPSPPREQREEVQRRRIAPVQIFEHQNERAFRGGRLQRFGHLAQHPLAGRSRHDQAAAFFRRQALEDRRHLREPGRRVLAEVRDQVLAARLSAQLAEGGEDRQVRLACAEVLDALTATDECLADVRRAVDERVDQRGLADARLAADEDHAALATPCGVPPGVEARELGLAPDQRG